MIKMRVMEKKDIKACTAIVEQNYTPAYAQCAARELRHMFKENIVGLTFVVAEKKGKIIGFAAFAQDWMDYQVSGIFWVNVCPEEKGKGLGRRLVRRVISMIRKSSPRTDLILLTARPEVRGYYLQFGFKPLCRFGPKNYTLMGLVM